MNNSKLILPVHENELEFNKTETIIPKPSVINNIIINNREKSPPYKWSDGIFQRWKPISGNFKIGNNFYGNNYCSNNSTGRAFYANPCGYWNNVNDQFFSGNTYKNTELQPWNSGNINIKGNLYPVKQGNTSPPQDRVVFGYARIGEEFRGR